jgi:hypothetical protein
MERRGRIDGYIMGLGIVIVAGIFAFAWEGVSSSTAVFAGRETECQKQAARSGVNSFIHHGGSSILTLLAESFQAWMM